MSKWSNPPDFEEVHTAYMLLADIKGKIRILNTEIAITAIEIKKTSPRKPHLVLEATQEQERELAALEASKEQVELQVKWFEFWKDMYRSDSYKR